jgi:preprotein translocase subunit SecA
MGALAMIKGNVAEMATGEGQDAHRRDGRVHLGVGRQAGARHHRQRLPRAARRRAHGADLRAARLKVGYVTHETTPQERIDNYRRGVVYITSKELVADFLRDQIALGTCARTQTRGC